MENKFIFTNLLKFFEIEEKGKKRFFVKGDFSSTDLDLVNDICTENCLKSMVYQINSGRIKLDFEHEAFRGNDNEEKEINKTRLPLAKAISAEKKGRSAEATWELNEDYKRFDGTGSITMNFSEVKSNVENGMLDAFSIAYIPTKVSYKDQNGEQIRLLDDVKLLNVALTGNPVNTAAQIRQVFTKSMDAIEEYKKEKKSNPEIENLLEVKATPKERRTQARNEAVREGDEDEDEDEETKKYKKEKKTYEKDGGHAHTENEPLGLHNHPEIEEIVRLQNEHLHDRINFLSDRLLEILDDPSPEEVIAIKAKIESKPFAGFANFNQCVLAQKKKGKSEESAKKICGELQSRSESKSSHKGNQNTSKDIKKGEEIKEMVKENESVESAESAPVEKQAENAESGESQSNSEKPLEEIKNLLTKQSERIDSFEKDMKGLMEVKSKELKTNQKVIQENLDMKNVAKEVKAIGGISELQ